MIAAVLTGIRQMEIQDLPMPKITLDNDVLLKVEMVGICGSDVHYFETGRIGSQVVEFPFVVGHECAATVVDTGSDVSKVKPGDKVVIDPAMPCFQCDQCKAGRENTCRNLKFLGCPGQSAGCLSRYIVMPEQNCFVVEPGFSLERAVLCEPLAIGYYAVEQAALTDGASAAILGAGPIGLSCLVSAPVFGAGNIYVTDKIDTRVQIAINAGAKWAGNPNNQSIVDQILDAETNGVDVVFEAAGQQETIDQALDILKPGGRLMIIGIPRFDSFRFVADKIRRKEITIINVRRQNRCTQKCIDLISAGLINVDFMVTHRFELEQTTEAFDLVAEYRDGVIKAMIKL